MQKLHFIFTFTCTGFVKYSSLCGLYSAGRSVCWQDLFEPCADLLSAYSVTTQWLATQQFRSVICDFLPLMLEDCVRHPPSRFSRHQPPAQSQECRSSRTISMKWNPVSSSQLRWSRKGSSHFWMSYSSGTQVVPSQQRCTGKPPTQTATSTSSPIIHWPTNLPWSKCCTAG